MNYLFIWFCLCITIFAQEVNTSMSQENGYHIKEVDVQYTNTPEPKNFLADLAFGNIIIKQSKKDHAYAHIYIRVEDKEILDDIRIYPKENSEKLQLEIETNRSSFRDTKIEATLFLPQKTYVSVNTHGGSIYGQHYIGHIKAKTSGGSIKFTDITGTINSRTSGGSLSFTDIKGMVNGRTSGGSIKAQSISGDLEVRTSGGSIRIREVVGNVNCNTSGGKIVVEDVEKSLTAHTSGGSVTIERIGERADVSTSGGSIKFNTIGGELRAETSGGSIRGSNVKGYAELNTSSGNIQATEMFAPVRAESNGDITVEMDLTDYKGNEQSYLGNSFGDIDLTLTNKSSFRLDVRARSFGKRNIKSDFDLEFTEKNRAHYSHNDGDIDIKISARNGKVYINKK